MSLTEQVDEFLQNLSEKEALKLIGMVAGIIIGVFVLYLVFLAPSFSLNVTDENGNSLSGALVELFDGNGNKVGETITGPNGNAHFAVDSNQPYSFTVTKDGYDALYGDYDPNNPLSSIQLSPTRTPGERPGKGGLEFQPGVKPPLPTLSSPVVISTPTPRPTITPLPRPTLQVPNAILEVRVREQNTFTPISNAVVILRNSATGTAIGSQHAVNDQGVLIAHLVQGMAVAVQAMAPNYVNSDPQTVSLDSEQTPTTILMEASSSENTANSTITVQDAQEQRVNRARVQVLGLQGSVYSEVYDELTSDQGEVTILLETGRQYLLYVSKQGYSDANAEFAGGSNASVTMQQSNQALAQLSVTVQYSNNEPVGNASVALRKRVQGALIDYKSQTANEQGVARFENVQVMPLNIAASSSDHSTSANQDYAMQAGENQASLTLQIPAPQPSATPTPPPCTGDRCQQTNTTPTPTPAHPPSGQTHRVCLEGDNRSVTITNPENHRVQYQLHDLSSGLAIFQVSVENSVVCSGYTPSCTYSLGKLTVANRQLAEVTGLIVYVSSIDLQSRCAEITIGSELQCQGNNCPCPFGGEPVCGTNGISYASSCHAQRVPTTFVEGTCSLQCIPQYDPVCGANGRTYDNLCRARQANALPTQPGECPPPARTITMQLPSGWSSIAPFNAGNLDSSTCSYVPPGTTSEPIRFLFSMPTGSGQYLVTPINQNSPTNTHYPDGYLVYSDHACQVKWQNQGTPTYNVQLQEGWQIIAGPPTAATFNQIRGTCPEYLGPPSPTPSATPTATPTNLPSPTPGNGVDAVILTNPIAKGPFMPGYDTSCAGGLATGFSYALFGAATAGELNCAQPEVDAPGTPILGLVTTSSVSIDYPTCSTISVPSTFSSVSCPTDTFMTGFSRSAGNLNRINSIQCCKIRTIASVQDFGVVTRPSGDTAVHGDTVLEGTLSNRLVYESGAIGSSVGAGCPVNSIVTGLTNTQNANPIDGSGVSMVCRDAKVQVSRSVSTAPNNEWSFTNHINPIYVYVANGVPSTNTPELDKFQVLGENDVLQPGRGYMVYYDGSAGSICTLSAP